MNDIYKKLMHLRNENWKHEEDKFKRNSKEDVFKQLLCCAFFNQNNPGNLPSSFTIENIQFGVPYTKSLIEQLGIKVNVELVDLNSKGYCFNVILKEKDQ